MGTHQKRLGWNIQLSGNEEYAQATAKPKSSATEKTHFQPKIAILMRTYDFLEKHAKDTRACACEIEQQTNILDKQQTNILYKVLC